MSRYYTGKIESHGPTARGVDWNSTESQVVRFEQLCKICGGATSFSINDYGCGYGALVEFLRRRNYEFRYCGYDVCPAMIARARELHRGRKPCRFVTVESRLDPADFAVASGVFNVRLDTSAEEWTAYLLDTIGKLCAVSRKGFAFNCLTQYSDPERMRPDLYYADPCFLFDYCKRHFSREVALLHDYGLYEFTMLIRKREFS